MNRTLLKQRSLVPSIVRLATRIGHLLPPAAQTWRLISFARSVIRSSLAIHDGGSEFASLRFPDHVMHLPWEGKYLFLLRPYEPLTTQLFKHELAEGMTVIDVGAHWGYYSLLAASRVGATGAVIAFEPSPDNYEVLCHNIRLNGFRNIIAVKSALAARAESREFHRTRSSHFNGFAPHPLSPTTAIVTVNALPLDDYLKGRRVHVIKIDIEGAEPIALQGMQRTMGSNYPLTMFVEFNPACLRNMGHDPIKLVETIQDHGFEVQVADDHTRKLTPIRDFLGDTPTDPRWYGNLFCHKLK